MKAASRNTWQYRELLKSARDWLYECRIIRTYMVLRWRFRDSSAGIDPVNWFSPSKLHSHIVERITMQLCEQEDGTTDDAAHSALGGMGIHTATPRQ